VVVDIDRSHLRRGEVGVREPSNELSMIFCAEGPREEPLESARGKEDYRVAQVHDSHSASVIKPPAVSHRRWNRHLPACGDEELCRNAH
jgi:hypothetical protein